MGTHDGFEHLGGYRQMVFMVMDGNNGLTPNIGAISCV